MYSQDTSNSLAFKRNRPLEKYPMFYRPDLSYQIIQQFRLIQQANSGDAIAQHELGLRLLFGDGIATDTPSAVNWIRKAAQQNLSAAQYNYGLMLLNGIGVDWNPFEAFKFFFNAANQNFAPAQYILGIIYTDNLIVPRDLRKSYYWINKSKANQYAVDEEVIESIYSRLPASFIDSLSKNLISFNDKFIKQNQINESNQDFTSQSVKEVLDLSFIDFDAKENIITVGEENILKDLLNLNFIIDSVITNIKTIDDFIARYGFDKLMLLSNYDVPEVLTLLGYLYREGKYVSKDNLKAIEYLILAVRYDSPTAANYLLSLINDKSLLQSLKKELTQENNSAKFVWYGLARFGFLSDIILNDVYELLNQSAKGLHINSINELALNYYIGNHFPKDIDKAIELWRMSEQLGSHSATIRILLSKIFDHTQQIDSKIFNSLINFEQKGSILAQVAIGFCYENGKGINQNKALAAKYYRKAAQRGNIFAYERLKKLYDNIRPNLSEFKVN